LAPVLLERSGKLGEAIKELPAASNSIRRSRMLTLSYSVIREHLQFMPQNIRLRSPQ